MSCCCLGTSFPQSFLSTQMERYHGKVVNTPCFDGGGYAKPLYLVKEVELVSAPFQKCRMTLMTAVKEQMAIWLDNRYNDIERVCRIDVSYGRASPDQRHALVM